MTLITRLSLVHPTSSVQGMQRHDRVRGAAPVELVHSGRSSQAFEQALATMMPCLRRLGEGKPAGVMFDHDLAQAQAFCRQFNGMSLDDYLARAAADCMAFCSGLLQIVQELAAAGRVAAADWDQLHKKSGADVRALLRAYECLHKGACAVAAPHSTSTAARSTAGRPATD